MLVPGRTIEQVFKAVRNNVIDETNNLQVPWESTSLRGDFYFILPQTSQSNDSCSVKCGPNTKALEKVMQSSQEHLRYYDQLKKDEKQNYPEFIDIIKKIICDLRYIEDTLQENYVVTLDEDSRKMRMNTAQTRDKFEKELCAKFKNK